MEICLGVHGELQLQGGWVWRWEAQRRLSRANEWRRRVVWHPPASPVWHWHLALEMTAEEAIEPRARRGRGGVARAGHNRFAGGLFG